MAYIQGFYVNGGFVGNQTKNPPIRRVCIQIVILEVILPNTTSKNNLTRSATWL